jgi:hypothetical protein
MMLQYDKVTNYYNQFVYQELIQYIAQDLSSNRWPVLARYTVIADSMANSEVSLLT